MEDWLKRLYDEHNELRIRSYKLQDFLRNRAHHVEVQAELELMKRQSEVMKEYEEILQSRIDLH